MSEKVSEESSSPTEDGIFAKEDNFGGHTMEGFYEMAEGKISKSDRERLQAAGLHLRQYIEQLELQTPITKIVFPGTGARLLRPFVDGLTEDLFEKQHPEREFVQPYLKSSTQEDYQKNQELLKERVKELVGKEKEGVYLVVDDYVSHRLNTARALREAFLEAGVSDENIRMFSMIGEKAIMGGAGFFSEEELEEKEREGYTINWAAQDLVLPPDYYQKRGVTVGVVDPRVSSWLDASQHKQLKGTVKQPNSKYEKALPSKESPQAKKAAIRDNMYLFGKMVAKRAKEGI
jgi:hypothetical protein